MKDLIIKFIQLLVPPMYPDPLGTDLSYETQKYDQRNRRWRWTVFFGLLGAYTLIFIQHVIYFGIPNVYAGSVARRDDVEEIRILTKALLDAQQAKLANIEAITTRTDIRITTRELLDAKIGLCTSKEKLWFSEKLADLRRTYYAMTQQSWNEPTCKELGHDSDNR